MIKNQYGQYLLRIADEMEQRESKRHHNRQ